LEQNRSVSSFDIYRPSWEYLKDCPKFLSISRALQANPVVRERKKKHGNEESPCEADNREWKREAKKESRPLGNKASKCRAEEEDIITNVTAKLSERSTGTTSGAAVAMAIFQDWRERTSFQLVDPELRKTYEELKIKEQIHRMQQEQKAREEQPPPPEEEVEDGDEEMEKGAIGGPEEMEESDAEAEQEASLEAALIAEAEEEAECAWLDEEERKQSEDKQQQRKE
jgi:hypothetical protein